MVHAEGVKKLVAAFYRTEAGAEPAKDFLKGRKITDEDRKLIGRDIAKVEFGWPIGMPTCEPLGHGLFEIRTHLPNNRITRVYFCIHNETMLILHGFIKKASTGLKAPRHEIEVAQKRRDDTKRRS